jgi:hypothetical protein
MAAVLADQQIRQGGFELKRAVCSTCATANSSSAVGDGCLAP